MLVIKNIDKIKGDSYGKYRVLDVMGTLDSYMFTIIDTDDTRPFRLDLMKKKVEYGFWELRYSPNKFFIVKEEHICDRFELLNTMIELIITHRKPIKKC